MKMWFILSCIILLSLQLYSQNTQNAEQIVSDILESIAQNSESGDYNTQAFEDLLDLMQNPIRLNSCSKNELNQIIFLNQAQVNSLYNYLVKSRPIYSIYQLQSITEINTQTLQALNHFVNFDVAPKEQSYKYLKGNLILRDIVNVDNQTSYIGDKHHLYSRFQMNYGKFTAGFTLDKDAGEQMPGKHPNIIDFASTYAMYESENTIRNIIIGDYQINIGQGLTLWTGTNMGKSADIFSCIKRNKALSKYTSANENGYLRGVAIQLNFKAFDIVLFGSHKKTDAHLETLSDTTILLSLPTSGYHRTTYELENRKNLKQSTIGAFAKYKFNNLNIYGGAYYNEFDFDSVKIQNIYKSYSSPQQKSTVFTTGYEFTYEKFLFFGESSSTEQMKLATINGVIFTPQANLSLSMLYRYATIKYNSLYSNAFFENSSPGGEEGFYAGIKFSPFKHLKISSYVDIYRHKWIKYQSNAPSYGSEVFLNASYQISRNFNCYFRYSNKEKMKNTQVDLENNYQLISYTTQKFRFHTSYSSSNIYEVQFRFEQSYYNSQTINSKGYLSYINLKLMFQQQKLNFWLRYSIFNTNDYNSRIYSYENDLLYNFSTPAFFYNGSKFYIQGQWKINRALRIWMKYAYLQYTETKNGLNNNPSPSQTQTIIKMQLQYVF